jgi:uncharacterized protein (TIGR02246 family)
MIRSTHILLMIALTAISTVAQSSNKDSAADETAIRQIVQQVQDGWNTHDGKAFAAPFAEDADYVIVNGQHIKGRTMIETGHTAIFATIYKDSRNAATIKSIRFPAAGVAITHIEWNLEFRLGGELQKGQAMNTMVMLKDKGKWSIAAFHNTPIQSAPARGGNADASK